MATEFKQEHGFDLFDLFFMTPKEVEKLLFREIRRTAPNLEKIKVILDSGLVNLNAKTNWGWTALRTAMYHNRLDIAQLLISYGADVNAKDNIGRTPLHSAAAENSLATAQYLISSGADLEARDNIGYTPLNWAVREDFQEMQELLISYKK